MTMDETILFPSPNWFQVSGIAASSDGWLIYGGPSKSLCLLEPLPADYNTVVKGQSAYTAHCVHRAHPEKITSVDISTEWPEKLAFITGSADGSVRQWLISRSDNVTLVKTTHVHEVHSNEKEEIVGIGYSNETYAISVGTFGKVVKWDINSNVTKLYSTVLKNFRPTSMCCSRHVPLNVAVGTKQGIIFVLDLNGQGKIIYKVRAHDEDVMQLSWCPQYKVEVRKSLKDGLTARLDKIRNEPEPKDSSLNNLSSVDGDLSNINNKASNSSDINDVSKCSGDTDNAKDETKSVKSINKSATESLEDTEIVEEEDLFDVYKDHEANEFGHKKYQPENITVKLKSGDESQNDFLSECLKLKGDILKNKLESEETIESLVDALDKTHVDKGKVDDDGDGDEGAVCYSDETASLHTHRHLLATVGKNGGIRIWSKTGKLVSSCAVFNNSVKTKQKSTWFTLLWLKADTLLIADGKGQLVELNPMKMDSKTKLEWRILHSVHRRGVFSITSAAPRVQTSADATRQWTVWTAAQDRYMVEYCLEKRKVLSVRSTCGGWVYCISPCPYDARKVAIGVSDGTVRVWQADTAADSDAVLTPGQVSMYWQNVKGKVLNVAWHPTRENLLAFATAEARVGIIDSSGKGEKPAKVLRPSLSNGIYSLCWGDGNTLYASGGGELVAYETDKPDAAPTSIKVEVEGAQWKVCEVLWSERAMLVGSVNGAVAALTSSTPHTVVAVAFPFTKVIHQISWHPVQVSESAEESPNKDLIAVCSLEKNYNIVILQLGPNEDGDIKLSVHTTLTGHKGVTYRVIWNPHKEGQLMSASHDSTVRVWDVLSGTCVSIFAGGRPGPVLAAAWSAHPGLSAMGMSGGSDHALRLWQTSMHAADNYVEMKPEKKEKKKNKEKETAIATEVSEEQEDNSDLKQAAGKLGTRVKISRKFLLPIMHKEIQAQSATACRKLLKKYKEKLTNDNEGGVNGNGIEVNEEDDLASDYVKIFGNINEVNEVIEKEMQRHEVLENHEALIMLSIFRGHIDSVFKYAAQRDLICPYLLSLAPCVSVKYWKDATQMYLSQIDRLVARGEEHKLNESKSYGGAVYRKAATLLCIHDVKGALGVLTEAHLFKEAYVLCRVRHMDSIAEETLQTWARHNYECGSFVSAAVCYVAAGNLTEAATVLGRSIDEAHLNLAADIAKLSGQPTFASHIQEKVDQIKLINQTKKDVNDELAQLPSMMDLLMKKSDDVCVDTGE